MADVIDQLAQAIARFEGFFQPNSVAARNHNPGNLVYVGQTGARGVQIKGTDGKIRTYAAFDTDDAGWAALRHDLELKLSARPDLTIAQLINIWAPPSDNNPTSNYARYVANQLGIDVNARLNQFFRPGGR